MDSPYNFRIGTSLKFAWSWCVQLIRIPSPTSWVTLNGCLGVKSGSNRWKTLLLIIGVLQRTDRPSPRISPRFVLILACTCSRLQRIALSRGPTDVVISLQPSPAHLSVDQEKIALHRLNLEPLPPTLRATGTPTVAAGVCRT